MLRGIVAVVALLGVISAVSLTRKLRTEPPPPQPLVMPARSPFLGAVGGQGIIESLDEDVRVAAPQPGIVRQVFVQVGDTVTSGDPLFQLDSRDAEAQVRLAEAEIPVLKARLSEAVTLENDRKDQLDRAKRLLAKSVVSEDEETRARFNFELARAARLRTEAELGQAQARLERAKVQLDILTVRATRDATVLRVNIRPGEFAGAQNATEPAMVLGHIKRLQLRAEIDETAASRVRPQARAYAFVKGDTSTSVPLQFVRFELLVQPKRSLTGASTERTDTRVLQVIYAFDPPPDVPLYVGQQMDVFIEDADAD